MKTRFKCFVMASLGAAILTACAQEKSSSLEPTATSNKTPELSQKSQVVNCSDLDLFIIKADWAKNSTEQQPHRLKVTEENGTTRFHDLGFDRSPDFFFEIVMSDYRNFVVLKGISRVLAYDCQNDRLQELAIKLSENFEALDAQSGLINRVSFDWDGLLVDVEDHPRMIFMLGPNRHFREPKVYKKNRVREICALKIRHAYDDEFFVGKLVIPDECKKYKAEYDARFRIVTVE